MGIQIENRSFDFGATAAGDVPTWLLPPFGSWSMHAPSTFPSCRLASPTRSIPQMPNRSGDPKSLAKLIRQSKKAYMHWRLSMDSIRLPVCLSSPCDAAQVRRLDEFVELRRLVAPSSPSSPPAAPRKHSRLLVQMRGLLCAHRLNYARSNLSSFASLNSLTPTPLAIKLVLAISVI
jgi:hypothetical protein